MWQVTTTLNQKLQKVVLAYGGRFDNLVAQYQLTPVK